MIIQPDFPSGFVLFCDDVREELHGKLTFVGVYGGEMTVYGTAPLALPTLSAVIRYRDDPTALPRKIAFRISLDNGENDETLWETEFDAPALPEEFQFPETRDADSRRFVELQIATKLAPLLIPGDCQIKVRAHLDGNEVRLGRLQIKVSSPQNQTEPSTA